MNAVTYQGHISRLHQLQANINQALAQRGPFDDGFEMSANTEKEPTTPDPIEKCLGEAEALLAEGRVMAAIEKENECLRLIAAAGDGN